MSTESNSGNSLQVIPVSHVTARQFIEKWHYSQRCPTGKNIFFGWADASGNLYAVADFGIGVNPYAAQYLAKITGEPVSNKNLVELKRLCRVEPKVDKFPLTKFIALCHKKLAKMGYCFVVSFSDPEHGHTGGIYKAASFRNLGKTNEERHVVDSGGVVRHRRYVFRHARRNGCTVQESRESLGLRIIKTAQKDRWFKRIANPPKTP